MFRDLSLGVHTACEVMGVGRLCPFNYCRPSRHGLRFCWHGSDIQADQATFLALLLLFFAWDLIPRFGVMAFLQVALITKHVTPSFLKKNERQRMGDSLLRGFCHHTGFRKNTWLCSAFYHLKSIVAKIGHRVKYLTMASRFLFISSAPPPLKPACLSAPRRPQTQRYHLHQEP